MTESTSRVARGPLAGTSRFVIPSKVLVLTKGGGISSPVTSVPVGDSGRLVGFISVGPALGKPGNNPRVGTPVVTAPFVPSSPGSPSLRKNLGGKTKKVRIEPLVSAPLVGPSL